MRKNSILRRLAMVVLVIAIAINSAVASAEGTDTQAVTVSSYEDLVAAIDEAAEGDTILLGGTVELPADAVLGDSSKTVKIDCCTFYIVTESDTSDDKQIVIQNITFTGASSYIGVMRLSSKAKVTNCIFENCKGTAVDISGGISTFEHCIFRNNTASSGGSHFCTNYRDVTFIGCSFINGVCEADGAVYATNNSTLTFRDCTISGNKGNNIGGIFSLGNVVIENTVLYGNLSRSGGGDFYCRGDYTLPNVEDITELYQKAGIIPLRWEENQEHYFTLVYEEYKEPEEIEPPTDEKENPEPTEPSESDKTGKDDNSPTDDEKSPVEGDNSHTEPPISSPNISDTGQNSGDKGTIDNSSDVSHVDNSSNRSENITTENSNNTPTVNNYYTQDSPKKEENSSNQSPVEVSVPVTINAPEADHTESGTEGRSVQQASESSEPVVEKSLPQDIKIDAENIDLVYEYGENGISISIKSTKEPESKETDDLSVSTDQAATASTQKSSSWVSVIGLILLGFLVFMEIRDKIKPHKEG